jgi:hypothetical protein
MTNLLQDGTKTDTNKRVSDLPLKGYSLAEKNGGHCTCSAGISPRNTFDTGNAEACVNSEKEDDEDYSPTPAQAHLSNTEAKDPRSKGHSQQ